MLSGQIDASIGFVEQRICRSPRRFGPVRPSTHVVWRAVPGDRECSFRVLAVIFRPNKFSGGKRGFTTASGIHCAELNAAGPYGVTRQHDAFLRLKTFRWKVDVARWSIGPHGAAIDMV